MMTDSTPATAAGPLPSEWPDLWWLSEDGITWTLYTRLALRRRRMNTYAGRSVAVKPSKRGSRA